MVVINRFGMSIKKIKIVIVMLTVILTGCSSGDRVGTMTTTEGPSQAGVSFDSNGIIPAIPDNTTSTYIRLHNLGNSPATIQSVQLVDKSDVNITLANGHDVQKATGFELGNDRICTSDLILHPALESGDSCVIPVQVLLTEKMQKTSEVIKVGFSQNGINKTINTVVNAVIVSPNSGIKLVSGVSIFGHGTRYAYGTIYVINTTAVEEIVQKIETDNKSVEVVDDLSKLHIPAFQVRPLSLLGNVSGDGAVTHVTLISSGLSNIAAYGDEVTSTSVQVVTSAAQPTPALHIGLHPVFDIQTKKSGKIRVSNIGTDKAYKLSFSSDNNKLMFSGATSEYDCTESLDASQYCDVPYTITTSDSDSANITFKYTDINGNSFQVPTEIQWYNGNNFNLLATYMTSGASRSTPLIFNVSEIGNATIIMKNIGGHVLRLPNIFELSKPDGKHASATIAMGGCALVNLNYGESCAFSVNITDNYSESGAIRIDMAVSSDSNIIEDLKQSLLVHFISKPTPPPNLRIYYAYNRATSYNGDLVTQAAQLATKLGRQTTFSNGIAAADYICNNDPDKPSAVPNGTTYKAMIVDGSTRIACTTANCSTGVKEHIDWVLQANTTYQNANGDKISTNANGLFTFPTANPIIPQNKWLSHFVWTGLTTSWISGSNCNGWRSSGSDTGEAGAQPWINQSKALGYSQVDYTGTECFSKTTLDNFDIGFGLYCVQQNQSLLATAITKGESITTPLIFSATLSGTTAVTIKNIGSSVLTLPKTFAVQNSGNNSVTTIDMKACAQATLSYDESCEISANISDAKVESGVVKITITASSTGVESNISQILPIYFIAKQLGPLKIYYASNNTNGYDADMLSQATQLAQNLGKSGMVFSDGIEAADYICNNDKGKPSGDVDATYKALIVDGSARIACTTAYCSGGEMEHVDWVLLANTAYQNTAGQIITTNAKGLFDFPTINPLMPQSQWLSNYVWTGLGANWTTEHSFTCNKWGSSLSTSGGYAGAQPWIGQSKSSSVYQVSGNMVSCSSKTHKNGDLSYPINVGLYCVQQKISEITN